MIKIALFKVFLASAQVLDLYGWLMHRLVHLQRGGKKKAFSLRDVALNAEKVTISKASLYFSTDICCLHVSVVIYRYCPWET